MSDQFNQTGFNIEKENLQEVVSHLPIPEVPIAPKNNKKKFILIGAFVFMFIMIILAMVLTREKDPVVQEPIKFNTPEDNKETEYSKKFKDLKSEITESDPTKFELVPPPVNYQINMSSQE